MDLLDLEKSVMPWIGKTGKMMTSFLMEKFKQCKLNLTIEQWVVLKTLIVEDGRIQNDMAMITNRNKTSLTRLVNNMEKNNLVVRIADKVDKRVNRVYLTKNGRSVYKNTMPIIKECIKEIQSDLNQKEIKILTTILKKVQNNIRKSSCTTN